GHADAQRGGAVRAGGVAARRPAASRASDPGPILRVGTGAAAVTTQQLAVVADGVVDAGRKQAHRNGVVVLVAGDAGQVDARDARVFGDVTATGRHVQIDPVQHGLEQVVGNVRANL